MKLTTTTFVSLDGVVRISRDPRAMASGVARQPERGLRPTRHGKRRSSSARAWTADSPKRRAHKLNKSSLSRKNFQSPMTPCLTNRNGTGDLNGRKLEL